MLRRCRLIDHIVRCSVDEARCIAGHRLTGSHGRWSLAGRGTVDTQVVVRVLLYTVVAVLWCEARLLLRQGSTHLGDIRRAN